LRGIASEDIACRALQDRGLAIRERRLRTPFAEVDILAYDPAAEIFVLIEVKTARAAAWNDVPIGKRQRARLRRARSWIERELGAPIAAELALVARDGTVAWAFDFLC
jgi:Holliday junction resolvase-like predicted endonuclease